MHTKWDSLIFFVKLTEKYSVATFERAVHNNKAIDLLGKEFVSFNISMAYDT